MDTRSTFNPLFVSQKIAQDERGHNFWRHVEEKTTIPAEKCAFLICDMWDQHWSSGATYRVGLLAPKINLFIQNMRSKGSLIIHAPSDTLNFYAKSPARHRLMIADKKQFKEKLKWLKNLRAPGFPLPIDDSDGGSDTKTIDKYKPNTKVWSRQVASIAIDEEKDGISDSGTEIHHFLLEKGIEYYFIMGVHTNMCVINRTFGIRMMRQTGLKVALVRDLTDAMYNPAKPPYVSHDKGTELVCDFIEKYYCPSVKSTDFF
jgi:nicotinamidase-related amidase